MRNNTQRIYERLIRGEFLSVDSADNSIRHLYDDLEENFEDYADYFKEIGLQLEQGNGYFYFSRIGEGKQAIEQKLESFSKWLDYLDFLKCLQSSILSWLPVSQRSSDRTNQSGHRTKGESQPLV